MPEGLNRKQAEKALVEMVDHIKRLVYEGKVDGIVFSLCYADGNAQSMFWWGANLQWPTVFGALVESLGYHVLRRFGLLAQNPLVPKTHDA